MAPKSTRKPASQTSSQKKPKPSNGTRARTVKLDETGPSSKLKRIDPLTAFSRHLPPSSTPPASSRGSSKSTPISTTYGGKGKEKDNGKIINDSLWVDRYEPTTEAELAVHVKKVDNVRHWLKEAFEGGPSGVFKKYRRILLLTGRAGTGKTSTIRVLSREMGFDILEWKASATLSNDHNPNSESFDTSSEVASEGLFSRFEAFLSRAATCNDIFATPATSNSPLTNSRPHIILLEDLPNVLHYETQTRFHQALVSLVNSPPSEPPVPVVIIVSDAGMRGEEWDERLLEGRGFGRDKNQVVDGRTVIPRELLHGVYVTEIGFNPIAPTILRKALQLLLDKHFNSSPVPIALLPSKEVLEVIVDSSNGDIRSAIMALQFACILELPGSKKKGLGKGTTMVMEVVTRREQSLQLFHLLGKILYNKRKGDPPSSSANAKDLKREKALDALIKDPTGLPSHLQHHERRASRVDIDKIYSESPIDSSLFSLYIHQNYSQFCDEIDQCEAVSEWLSWIDSSGGDAWYQANPHQFHLLALGTLHSLPSPVTRRSQKCFKPEFFAFLEKQKNAWDGVQITRDWIVEKTMSVDDPCWRAGGWTKSEVVLEVGPVLKAMSMSAHPSKRPPNAHGLFSKMEFVRGGGNAEVQQLEEDDEPMYNAGDEETQIEGLTSSAGEKQLGGWLESDDIEDFD